MNKIEWLKLAVSNSLVRLSLAEPFITDDYEFATDGFRVHISKLDRTPSREETKGLGIGSRIDKFKAETVVKRLMIQPQYLIDALQGFSGEKDWVLIDLLENDEGVVVTIRLTCDNANNKNEAYIMCMKPPEEAKDESE